MTVDRLTPTSSTPGTVTGDAYMDSVAEEVSALWDRSANFLSSVGGTAAAITATLAPALTGAMVNGMRFYAIAASACVGATTLKINGGSVIPIIDKSAAALSNGIYAAGDLLDLLYDAATSSLRLMGVVSAIGTNYQPFTASGTWAKPAGKSADAPVLIECWGAGGGGGGTGIYSAGGGGGGYNYRWMRLGDFGTTVSVTVGAGGTSGAVGGVGGNSTFGSAVTGYGGGGGANSATSGSPGGGGGGGGPMSAGVSGSGTSGGAGGTVGATNNNSSHGSGGGGDSGNPGGSAVVGGGGGGGGSGSNGRVGGPSQFGGGGGGGSGATTTGVGGSSAYAGNGGASGSAGSAPAGGGGRSGVGARGEVRVRVF